MNEALREKLKLVSVTTLATALFKRGLRNQVLQGVHPIRAKGVNMVGPAYTLRYIPARGRPKPTGRIPQSRAPSARRGGNLPAGHVLVMDSRKDPRAASAGDILVTRLMVRGVAGVVPMAVSAMQPP